jgi:hypothetical protein
MMPERRDRADRHLPGMDTWDPRPGVVELPSGRRVRGRALRARSAAGAQTPHFGVYLLARPPSDLTWDHRWVRCGDFRTPSDTEATLSVLQEGIARADVERVEVGCAGGIGRTGLALSVLAVLDGVDPSEAVAWVRGNYHRRAVETPRQRRWVARLTV